MNYRIANEKSGRFNRQRSNDYFRWLQWNPSGFENICEDENYETKWYVLHAEANAILKVAASTQSCEGATLYITLSPCKECSKLIHQSGIKRVVYAKAYRDLSGVKFLEKAGVKVEHFTLENKEA